MNSKPFFMGRIARLNYFVSSVLTGIAAWLCTTALSLAVGWATGIIGFLIVFIVSGFLGLSLVVRRCHDLGWSGWWALLMIIPFVNIVFAPILLFKRGMEVSNAYGLVPSAEVAIWPTLFPRRPTAGISSMPAS
ncbi:MAG: DUF805 domain-containing protein [Patescibacteria group bacterium]|nr:DUF805 domain-containing protein [Patescibacteria group bacterium]MDE1945389.1 DUF805 domain-containing protein [Patescibacteria group bacterium]MDE2057457.1 DUF805 domain-containing protein [Patescibacteria group bacterium]